MRVRDAVEEDGDVLGELADAPAEVMRNVIHDRTVRVAERGEESDDATEGGDGDAADSDDGVDEDADGPNGGRPEVAGFVGFDAMPGTVRVTYLRGSRAARERLLEEPVRFARKEGMAVEALVPEDEAETRTVVEDAGFRRVGTGPRFEGGRTVKYRLDTTTP
ncbi:hypothetical protein [Halorussus caseinilyticus]|uniref:hypothetical protein n=1 Tax=Halorussus caseinilyticus TaxID=3034025 RepID=UPI0023E7B009|nr:hypothetical protein [Halorussus sp. DT72]